MASKLWLLMMISMIVNTLCNPNELSDESELEFYCKQIGRSETPRNRPLKSSLSSKSQSPKVRDAAKYVQFTGVPDCEQPLPTQGDEMQQIGDSHSTQESDAEAADVQMMMRNVVCGVVISIPVMAALLYVFLETR